MNRRSFFKTLAVAAAGFTVLPSATTYARTAWKQTAESELWIPNPEYSNAPYEMAWVWTGPNGFENASKYVGVVFNRGDGLVLMGDGSVRIKEPLPIRYKSLSPEATPISPYMKYVKPLKHGL